MIQITLGEKTYHLPYITARALRQIGPMDGMYERATNNEPMSGKDMDEATHWLCGLFGHQFTPDAVLDGYPMATFWVDVFTLYLTVRQQVEVELLTFPTRPGAATETSGPA